MQDIFAERLINLQIHQGIARLDFARLETIDVEKNQATFAPAFRLAMPVDAFIQMTEQFQKVRESIQNKVKDQANKPPAA